MNDSVSTDMADANVVLDTVTLDTSKPITVKIDGTDATVEGEVIGYVDGSPEPVATEDDAKRPF